jgi:hypothetical protein
VNRSQGLESNPQEECAKGERITSNRLRCRVHKAMCITVCCPLHPAASPPAAPPARFPGHTAAAATPRLCTAAVPPPGCCPAGAGRGMVIHVHSCFHRVRSRPPTHPPTPHTRAPPPPPAHTPLCCAPPTHTRGTRWRCPCRAAPSRIARPASGEAIDEAMVRLRLQGALPQDPAAPPAAPRRTNTR